MIAPTRASDVIEVLRDVLLAAHEGTQEAEQWVPEIGCWITRLPMWFLLFGTFDSSLASLGVLRTRRSMWTIYDLTQGLLCEVRRAYT